MPVQQALSSLVVVRDRRMNASLRYAISGPNVIHETVDGETIIINLLTGRYYSLQATGAQIWSLIQQGASPGEMAVYMSRRYENTGEEMAEVVGLFLAQLLAEDLIRAEPTEQSSSPRLPELASATDPAASAPPFVRPLLQKYTDMEDLLLLDPIHEVDDSGWPAPKLAPRPAITSAGEDSLPRQ
jgi:hypothetical protein